MQARDENVNRSTIHKTKVKTDDERTRGDKKKKKNMVIRKFTGIENVIC